MSTVSETIAQLNEAQKKHLKRLAHHRKPIVQTGANGLSDAVLAEVERALHDHELIKVRLVAGDRTERSAMIGEVCERTRSALVQRIGHVAVLFRANPDKPVIELPGSNRGKADKARPGKRTGRKTAHS
ncbi:RNA-binding protein [Natronospira proteinivora]|uniref:RNA-binding protein n=1 Tax=Natronospira proteinivora TaxID=1807133 RepID=A0ABT1G6W6_9GAMM|nr:RNA-binding protein [Natronospira proteinivora]